MTALRPTRWVGAAVAAGMATVTAEFLYAHHKTMPEFVDLDASGTFGNPQAQRLDVVAVGDSSTTGPGLVDPTHIWVRQVLTHVAHRYCISLTSLAAGGAKTADVIEHQLPAATWRRRHVAFVSAGANDAMKGVRFAVVEQRLTEIVEVLLQSSDAVILLGVGDVGTAPRAPFPLSTVATALARRTDIAQARVAAGRDRVWKVPMWELTTPTFRSGGDLFSPDGFHPNHHGHAVWAGAVTPTFLNVIATLEAKGALAAVTTRTGAEAR